ncbi:MAG TPA: hypothetical protein VJB16_00450 [archaeon]|nr:hypothetical protein [archaeon]
MFNEKPRTSPLLLALLVIAVGLLALNQWQIATVSGKLASAARPAVSASSTAPAQTATEAAAIQAAIAAVIPAGQPWWGAELGISFEDPIALLKVLNYYDDLEGSNGRGSKPIVLSAAAQQRYIAIGMSISCEYCCGAPTMVFQDGTPACGCAHSGAMRGLAKYLLSKYPERSDAEILGEVAKVKALSFPQQTVQKYLASTGSSAAASLPSQVGGC